MRAYMEEESRLIYTTHTRRISEIFQTNIHNSTIVTPREKNTSAHNSSTHDSINQMKNKKNSVLTININ